MSMQYIIAMIKFGLSPIIVNKIEKILKVIVISYKHFIRSTCNLSANESCQTKKIIVLY